MPVNWVDGVTPVNAANLETMEADTAAKQALTEKAAANGYAPLDATAKVPLVHLPPVSGVDYIGTWGSGIAYKRGDVVRYGSNDYLAVNDSTGVTPPAAYNVPLGGVSIGTALPASPYDGQEFVLVDSLTAPSFSWRFRYTAGITDANRWVFVGGGDGSHELNGTNEVTVVQGSYIDLATVGPRFVVPRAGVYALSCSALGSHSVVGTDVYITMYIGTVTNLIQSPVYTPGGGRWVAHETMSVQATLAANDEVRMRYYNGAAGTASWWMRWLRVRPVRVA